MSDKRWTVRACRVHGPTGGGPCREVVERTRTHIRYCHMDEEVEVIPTSSPAVLSPDEARGVAGYLEGSGREDIQALWLRLKGVADAKD